MPKKNLQMDNPLENSVLFGGSGDDAPMPTEDVKKKAGKKRIHDPNLRGSGAGLYEHETRATFIMEKETLDRLKNYAYTERLTLRKALQRILTDFLDDYEDSHEVLDHKEGGKE